MPKRIRHTPRSRSTPTQPNVEAEGIGEPNVPPRSEPVAEPTPPVVESGPSIQQDSLNQLDPSIEEDSEVVPDKSYHGRKSNKYWTVRLIDENNKTKEARLTVHDIFVLPSRQKIVLEWNKEGQPIGDAGGLLGQFLGHVACKPDNFPISYEKWPKVPSANKEHVWNHVIKKKFVVNNGMNKKYILSSLGKKWKDNRAELYNAYYDPTANWETNIQNHPKHVPRDQWAGILSYRTRQATKDMCKRNIENRRKQKVPHTLGSKTIAKKKHETETEHGRPCSRAEMWNIAHKKKNGSFVNEEAKKKSEELDMHTQNSSETEAFTKIFGKEHPRRVHSVGHCVAPSQFFGSTSYSGEEASFQANVEIQELKSEVKALRAQMVYFMEHFGAQMLDGHPNNNQDVDASSPALVRHSSTGSHDPSSLGSHNRIP
ncbi:hypothetical protein CDL12_14993 [Handroanthus impetiginosus]|uniref:Transposase Tnp1/En/Spm-like domain-containing protein n=1 Tax=Handroanthus impetiginosus TaxID=429701 RepID=A0A2G9H4G4_9LAMI|nr:hypothetical protein CDL12_14993 [Handroanthus impetiginosus]